MRNGHSAPREPSTASRELLDTKLTITVEEAATILGIGRSAAYEAARSGELPVRRIGRRLLVPVPALRAWLGLPMHTAEDCSHRVKWTSQ